VSPAAGEELGFFDAVRAAIHDEMAIDDRVMLWGENVVDPYGGLLQQYAGLSTAYPDRVLDSPLAETAIVGAALGAAMGGLRPIADVQIADFSFIAMEEIVRAARWRHMHGGAGDLRIPMVVKTLVGGYLGVGANHSQVPIGYWLHTPGLKVVFPSTPADGYGLMRSAIRDDDVVMFLAHKMLMFSTGPVAREATPFGRASVRRAGDDVTIVAIGYMNDLALQAADALAADEVSAEVIDPRTLEPLDLDTVLESVGRTRRLVVVDEDHVRCGMAGEICQLALEGLAPGALVARPRRVACAQVPLPEGPAELQVLPSVEGIVEAVRAAMSDSESV
jgi:pyruvate dehydrogenase E1 component beta subunit